MDCPDRKTLVMLADDELPAEERAAVARHAAGCSSCREFLGEIRALNLAARSSLQAIRVDQPRPIVSASRRRLPLRAAIAAAAMIIVGLAVGALLVMRPGDAGLVEVVNAPLPGDESPATNTATHRPVPPLPVTPLLDEEFERWAAEHRQKHIPLVPLEEVANFQTRSVPPIDPLAAEAGPRS